MHCFHLKKFILHENVAISGDECKSKLCISYCIYSRHKIALRNNVHYRSFKNHPDCTNCVNGTHAPAL